MTDTIISAAKDYISELFHGNSGGHDLAHSLRVYNLAMYIAGTEKSCDRTVVALAALLHDADDYKLFSTKDNANARAFLEGHGVEEGTIERICEAINSVSFSKNGTKAPSTIEGRIVQDADRLDALGAIGIARTFAYGGEHGRSLESTIRHFHEKLLLLKDGMSTRAARELARSRHAFLEEFLGRYESETAQDGVVYG
ncbi:MAG: HD domain-containing protein [Sphaerochaetaceae bacterium]|nr:HD domain-containing protein [Sphaerochaetaceae bacterium]